MNKDEKIILPKISDEERTPLVEELLDIIRRLQKKLDNCDAEIKRLKKHKSKPKLRASQLSKGRNVKETKSTFKKSKTPELKIHQIKKIEVIDIPPDAKFKGYKEYVVQDLEINVVNTIFKLARWSLPDGSYITAKLPEGYQNYHFGPTLRSYILHQYHNQDVTQPLLLEELREFGVEISSGELNRLLVENKSEFHEEKREILVTGLKGSNYIHADDTGARHEGRNGFCTHIGNEAFAYFESSRTKNRINFLEILHCGKIRYCLDLDVVEAALAHKFYYYGCTSMETFINQANGEIWFEKAMDLKEFVKGCGFESDHQFRYFREWGLLSSLRHQYKDNKMSLITDEAKQFDFPLFAHGLCWFHVERKIHEFALLQLKSNNYLH